MPTFLKNTRSSPAPATKSKVPFFKPHGYFGEVEPFFTASSKQLMNDIDGTPDIMKQDAGTDAGTPSTPCPNAVSIGSLASFNHSNLPDAEKTNWRTYLGVASQMNVGPGPNYSGHCMKERLTTVSNDCPAQVYSRGETESQPCTGNRCLDINSHASAGDALTRSMVSDGPTSFVDLHRTRNRSSLLEGSGRNSCSVVCEQIYLCDRTQATTGRFRITRNYQAGTYATASGPVHITTGNVTKVNAPTTP